MLEGIGKLPFGRVEVTTRVDVGAILERLESVVDQEPDLPTRMGGTLGVRGEKQFWGRFDETSFELHPVSTRGMFFVPCIHGTIGRDGDENRVVLTFSTPRSLTIGVIAYSTWLARMAYVNGESIPLDFVIVLGLVLVAGFLFALAPERKRAERILTALLCDVMPGQ